ncbi:MAG TPA: 2-succinyl-6-hydroxy-2,4-cyclohexadiene-1-carboxylate synthase, partial [Thermomicrobiales bacterium]|nr:2-succinyl-6-hydroxy-2,4-cyclohexadiene-1-carboxylate synthase [Thermomicrobiales bacterium]
DGPPVVLLHGFTGSIRTWDGLAPELARHHQVVAVDLLGHGATDAPGDAQRYAMERATADLAGLLDQLRIEQASVLGYSMGGRLALGFAVLHPERVAALVLESATAGIANETERSARRASDERLAESIERDGVARFVADWERLPLFATQARLPAARQAALRQDRLRQRERGLANSLRGFGQGAQPSLHARLAEIDCPVLLVVGEEDPKFRGIAAGLAARLSDALVTVVPEAGHAVHFEQPERFATIVQAFLQSAAPAGEGST